MDDDEFSKQIDALNDEKERLPPPPRPQIRRPNQAQVEKNDNETSHSKNGRSSEEQQALLRLEARRKELNERLEMRRRPPPPIINNNNDTSDNNGDMPNADTKETEQARKDLEEKNAALRSEVEDAHERNDALSKRLHAMEERLRSLIEDSESHAVLRTSFDSLQAQYSKLRSETDEQIPYLQKSNSTLADQLRRLEVDGGSQREEREKLQAQLETIQQRLADAQAEAERSQLQQRREETRAEEAMRERDDALTELETQSSRFAAENLALKEQHAEELRVLEEKLSRRWIASREKLELEYRNVTEELEAASLEIADLRSKPEIVADLDDDAESDKDDTVKSDADAKGSAVADRSEEVEALVQEKKELQETQAHLLERQLELTQQVTELEAELHNVRKDIAEHDNKSQLQLKDERIRELEQTLLDVEVQAEESITEWENYAKETEERVRRETGERCAECDRHRAKLVDVALLLEQVQDKLGL